MPGTPRAPTREASWNKDKDKEGVPIRALKTGYAYHGNRMPQHVEADLRDMVSHNANRIVHMFSHTDWDRPSL